MSAIAHHLHGHRTGHKATVAHLYYHGTVTSMNVPLLSLRVIALLKGVVEGDPYRHLTRKEAPSA